MGRGEKHYKPVFEGFTNESGKTAVVSQIKHGIIQGKGKYETKFVQTTPPIPVPKRANVPNGSKNVYGRNVDVVNNTVVSSTDKDGTKRSPFVNGQDMSGKMTLEQVRGQERRGNIEWRKTRGNISANTPAAKRAEADRAKTRKQINKLMRNVLRTETEDRVSTFVRTALRNGLPEDEVLRAANRLANRLRNTED